MYAVFITFHCIGGKRYTGFVEEVTQERNGVIQFPQRGIGDTTRRGGENAQSDAPKTQELMRVNGLKTDRTGDWGACVNFR